MSDVIVLCSGGLDSTVLAFHYARAQRLHSLLFFDWGHPARRMEEQTVVWMSNALGVECATLMVEMSGTRLMQGKGLCDVPARNLIFLSHALNYAATHAATSIAIGANSDDRGYPDCSTSFFIGFAETVKYLADVKLTIPFLYKSKRQIAALADEYGVNTNATWSCYNPKGDEPCDMCNGCMTRAAALK